MGTHYDGGTAIKAIKNKYFGLCIKSVFL